MIALVDYGAGNLTSVRKALSTLGADYATPDSPDACLTARGIIVPGVGHFDRTRVLDERWKRAMIDAVTRGSALLGICLGMQWLFDGSDEAPDVAGLGFINARCVRLPAAPYAPSAPGQPPRFKVPHVGWNSLLQPTSSTLLRGVAAGAQVYFTHSYVAPVVAESAAITSYGIDFSSAVEQGRVAGVQFHPEKSGDVGLQILKNWLHAL